MEDVEIAEQLAGNESMTLSEVLSGDGRVNPFTL